jgi:hypothetical protein
MKSLADKVKDIRLDSRNIKVKLAIVPSQEVQEQMFQLLKQHAQSEGDADPKFGTMSGSRPRIDFDRRRSYRVPSKTKIPSVVIRFVLGAPFWRPYELSDVE